MKERERENILTFHIKRVAAKRPNMTFYLSVTWSFYRSITNLLLQGATSALLSIFSRNEAKRVSVRPSVGPYVMLSTCEICRVYGLVALK